MQFMEVASPFAIYENGSGYVVPNNLPEMALAVLKRLEQESVDDVLASLRDSGRQMLARDISAQDAAKVWNFFLHHYLTQVGPEKRIERRSCRTDGEQKQQDERDAVQVNLGDDK